MSTRPRFSPSQRFLILFGVLFAGFVLAAVYLRQESELPDIAEDAVLIDVRTEAEYREEHLAGAFHIHYTEITERIGEISTDPNRQVLLYCTVGVRAGHAREALLDAGYRNVFNLGGLADLESQGFPIETSEGPD